MKRKPYRFFLYLLFRLLHIIIVILPYRMALGLAAFFGESAYYILPKYRDITLLNLRSVFAGEKSDDRIKKIARGVFRGLGMTAVECMKIPALDKGRSTDFMEGAEGIAVLKKALSEGRGAIALSSHIGNWEMAGAFVAANGIDITVIARRVYYRPYNNFLVSLRESRGVKTLYRDDKNVLKKSLNILKANRLLAIVPDQDVDSIKGVFVDFLGRKAYTPVGPAAISLLSGAPIVPTVAVRENGKLRFIAGKPIYPDPGADRDKDILRCTQKWSDAIEAYIRQYPSQWAWMHRRWKTRPE